MLREYEEQRLINGLPFYMQMFKESPWHALKEISACALILAMMIAILYL